MGRSSWLKDEQYLTECVEVVCERLNVTEPNKRKFIYELAHHSDSDGHFFNKVKVLFGLKSPQILKEDEEKPNKITVIMKEYNDGKDAELPPLLETRLRELRGDD